MCVLSSDLKLFISFALLISGTLPCIKIIFIVMIIYCFWVARVPDALPKHHDTRHRS